MASPLFVPVICLVCLVFTGSSDATCLMDYGIMSTEHKRCAANYPTVASLDRFLVSGPDMVAIFRGYCQSLEDITSCVRGVFTSAGCSDTDFEAYTARAERSNYFCDNGDIKPFISDIFQNIPTIGSYSMNGPCMNAARSGDEICRREAIAAAVAAGTGGGIEGFVGSMVWTMPCTLNHVISIPQCPRQNSVLTVSLRYGAVVVPPELGVNISQILLTMAQLE